VVRQMTHGEWGGYCAREDRGSRGQACDQARTIAIPNTSNGAVSASEVSFSTTMALAAVASAIMKADAALSFSAEASTTVSAARATNARLIWWGGLRPTAETGKTSTFCLLPTGLHLLHRPRILRDERVCSQQRDAFGPCLSNKDAVEWILVNRWQPVDRHRVRTVDDQFAVAVVH
jgi:hypothetical protein